ncbi:hypothetical protein [Saliphagus infecundisoli]|uniref:Small CPxCG-related zinc finger protein n=1 Tax=Saliphagus infecundisoli TaxID=1849069 RepID=A0ABD5QIR6_9EURY|nr:hypothetical protein [Saliphagus infecundisoli]
MSDTDDHAMMELDADAWHQDDEGNHYIDCPECGSAATLSNVVNHGRCNAFMDQAESDTELDETEFSCTASLSLELRYTSEPPGESDRETAEDPQEQADDVDIDDQASGTEGAPSN